MTTGVMKISVPTSKRKHTFYSVEVEGQEYWYDHTDAAKKRAFDSVRLYQKEEEERLSFARYIRKGLL